MRRELSRFELSQIWINDKQLGDLQQEHRDLDAAIQIMTDDPAVDQIRLKRMKKRKLNLKDMIGQLESRLIPDMDA